MIGQTNVNHAIAWAHLDLTESLLNMFPQFLSRRGMILVNDSHFSDWLYIIKSVSTSIEPLHPLKAARSHMIPEKNRTGWIWSGNWAQLPKAIWLVQWTCCSLNATSCFIVFFAAIWFPLSDITVPDVRLQGSCDILKKLKKVKPSTNQIQLPGMISCNSYWSIIFLPTSWLCMLHLMV